MSFRTVDRVWECSQQSGGPLLVLVALASWANDQGLVWGHKNSELAARARCSERLVRKYLKALYDSGELYTDPGSPGRGRSKPKLITVGLDENQLFSALDSGKFDLDYEQKIGLVNTIITTRKEEHTFPISNQKEEHTFPFKEEHTFPFSNQKEEQETLFTTYKGKYKDKVRENGKDQNARGAPAVLTKLDPAQKFDALILVLAKACQLDANLPAHRAQLEQAAAELAVKYGADDIQERYIKNGRADGWNWYANDWRGQKGQAPTLRAVIETIARQAPAGKAPAEMSTAEILAHARAQMAKGIV